MLFLPTSHSEALFACRSKHAESSFLELYQQLYEAPDPVAVLHGALGAESQLAQLVAQKAKLERELQDFQTESQGIKNQELTIRKLEERCKTLEADLTAKVRVLNCLSS
jgi:homeobox protein cut-like